MTATVSPENASNKGITWSSSNEEIASVDSSTGLITAKQTGSVTIMATAVDGSGIKGTCNVTVAAPSIPETTSYVGYYADVDGNGSVDGIIYADLAIGGSGQWSTSAGTYSIPRKSNLKKYEVSGTYNASGFGLKGIVKETGGNASGEERFYVMALSNISSSTYTWYSSAYGEMDDYATYTSEDFGTGEQNTSKMRIKWNSSGYGSQTSSDVWGLSEVKSGTWNGSSGWYVPSRAEWAAFGDAFDITRDNYINFGLSSEYWASSQESTATAWSAEYSSGIMYFDGSVTNNNYVRLGTTF